jgi:hypothetical protein
LDSSLPSPPPLEIQPPDPTRLAEQLLNIIRSETTEEDKTARILQQAIGLVNGAGIVFFKKKQSSFTAVAQLLSRQAASWSDDIITECSESCRQAMEAGQATIFALKKNRSASVLCCPAPDGGSGDQYCLGVIAILGNSAPEPFIIVMQLITAALVQLNSNLKQYSLLSALLEQQQEDIWTTARILEKWAGCTTLAIGTSDDNFRVKIGYVSNVTRINRRTHLSRLYTKVMRESLSEKSCLSWPRTEEKADSCKQSLILKELIRELSMARGMSVPLPSAGGFSVLLIFLWQDASGDGGKISELQDGRRLLRPLLYQSFSGSARRQSDNTRKRSRPLIIAGTAITLAILGLFAFLPVSFNLHTSGVIKPLQIRYVVARFDSLIDEVQVEPGDLVKEGQELISLDGREIELELSSIAAESAKALKMRDNYYAQGNIASAQISMIEHQRLEKRAELLKIHQTQLKLHSQINGIVLSSDLKRREGGPVSRGQTLLELAPLQTVLVELGVDDEDISHVKPGQKVSVYFDAFPDLSWQGAIEKISPKSELIDKKNLFIASFTLENSDGLLHPGMKGEGTIECGRKSPAWIYFRKPWYATLRFFRSLL